MRGLDFPALGELRWRAPGLAERSRQLECDAGPLFESSDQVELFDEQLAEQQPEVAAWLVGFIVDLIGCVRDPLRSVDASCVNPESGLNVAEQLGFSIVITAG